MPFSNGQTFCLALSQIMSLNFLLCMLCLCFGMRKHVLTFEQSSVRIHTSQIHRGAYFSYEVYPRPRSVRTHIPRRPSFTWYESCPCPAHDSGHARGGRRKTCIRNIHRNCCTASQLICFLSSQDNFLNFRNNFMFFRSMISRLFRRKILR